MNALRIIGRTIVVLVIGSGSAMAGLALADPELFMDLMVAAFLSR